MSQYRLEVSNRVQKRLRMLPSRLTKEVSEVIADLAVDPYLADSDELGRELQNRRRIRVEGWRIVYGIDTTNRVVKVLALRPRDENTYLNLP